LISRAAQLPGVLVWKASTPGGQFASRRPTAEPIEADPWSWMLTIAFSAIVNSYQSVSRVPPSAQ